MTKAYQFVVRSSDAEHGHPILVYTCSGQLHYELTRFAFLATAPLNYRTIKVYLYAILPFFTWLDTDEQQKRSGRHWRSPPEQVRWTVEDYLVQQMRCQLQQHHLGFQLIRPTARTPSQTRIFLVALKCFYKLMSRQGYYAYPNPLVDSLPEMLEKAEECLEEANQPPRLPDISGVQEPNLRQRLTDSYYKFVGEEWIPQIIDDASLPRQVLEGGRQLKGWGLREECVTRMLFETGARVSEIVGLALAEREVGSRGRIIVRPSQLNLDVRLSPHPASDSIRLCLCSCVDNRGMTHVELPDYCFSNCGDSHLYGASELAPRMLSLIRIWHMNGFVVLGL